MADLVAFHQKLLNAYGKPFDLHINDNSSSLITLRYSRSGTPRLSVHHLFLKGGDDIARGLAQYMRNPTAGCRETLRSFMDRHTGEIQPRAVAVRRRILRARGRNRDLNAMAAEVNNTYFEGKIAAHITFSSARARRGAFRNISFGSYDSKLRIVRIHPMLDKLDVPDFFVSFVIYHEMLHALIDPQHDADGRRRIHTPEFRQREMRYPDYERAKTWEKQFLDNVSKGKWPQK